jgi:hypothetical protein
MNFEWQGGFLYEVRPDRFIRGRFDRFVVGAISRKDYTANEWLATYWEDDRRTSPASGNIPFHLTDEEARKYVEALVRLTLSPRS